MITKSQKIRLGIFISSATLILILVIFVLSVKRFFKEKDVYYISYQNVSVTGLDVGSSVKYLGINVGTIQKIQIDPEDISRIIVTVGLNEGTPIKNDARADISTIGITGIKIVEIRGGTHEAPLLEPGGYIKAGKSITEDITGKAEDIAEKFELLLNNLLNVTSSANQEKVFKLIDEAALTVDNFNSILSKNKEKINKLFTNLDTAMNQLAVASTATRVTMQGLANVVSSDSFQITIDNIAQIADKLNKSNIYNLDEQVNIAVTRINQLLYALDLIVKNNQIKFNETIDDLNETVHYLNNAARQIDEDPSILLGGTEPDNPPDDKLEQ